MGLRIYHAEEMLSGEFVALFYGSYDEMVSFVKLHNLPARVDLVPNIFFSPGNPYDDLIPGVLIYDDDPAKIITFMMVALNDAN